MPETTNCRTAPQASNNTRNAQTAMLPREERYVDDPQTKKAVLGKLHELRDALLDLGSAWQSYEFTRDDTAVGESE
jgi:hypothetical protein